MPLSRSALNFTSDRTLTLDMTMSGDSTFEVFFKWPPGPNPTGGWRSLVAGPDGTQFGFFEDASSTLVFGVGAGTGVGRSLLSLGTLAPGWHHLAVVQADLARYDAVRPDGWGALTGPASAPLVWAYLDGRATGTALNISPHNAFWRVGNSAMSPVGALCELRLWNRALSWAEVWCNAATPRLNLPDEGLVAYVPMGDGAGETVRDVVRQRDCALSGDTSVPVWIGSEAITITPAALTDAHKATVEEARKAAATRRARAAVLAKRARVAAADRGAKDKAAASALAAARAVVHGTAAGEAAGRFSHRFTGDVVLTLTKALALPAAWTVEAFFKHPQPATAGGWRTLLRGPDGDHHVLVRADGTLGVYSWGPGDTPTRFFPSEYSLATLGDGWHHLAAVGSGAETVFYVDGAKVGTSAARATEPVKRLGNLTGQAFGSVADLRFWGRALGGAEVHVNSTLSTLTGHEDDLLAYYPFTKGSGASVEEATGGSGGTLAGTPSWTAFPADPWSAVTAEPPAELAADVGALTHARARALPAIARRVADARASQAAETIRSRALTIAPVVGSGRSVSIELVNPSDNQPALYLEESAQALRLTITNGGPTPLQVVGGARASRVELRFRPGSLASGCVVTLDGSPEWALDDASQPDGTRVLSLTRETGAAVTVPALVLQLAGFVPEAAGGTRAIRVQVCWFLSSATGTVNQGSQQVHVSVVFPTANALKARLDTHLAAFTDHQAAFAASNAAFDTHLAEFDAHRTAFTAHQTAYGDQAKKLVLDEGNFKSSDAAFNELLGSGRSARPTDLKPAILELYAVVCNLHQLVKDETSTRAELGTSVAAVGRSVTELGVALRAENTGTAGGLNRSVTDLSAGLADVKTWMTGVKAASEPGDLMAYIDGDPAVLVSGPGGTGYANTLVLCVLNPGAELVLGAAAKLTVDLGLGQPWGLCDAPEATGLVLKAKLAEAPDSSVTLTAGAGDWKPASGTWPKGKHLTLTLTGLVSRRKPGEARIRVDYEGLLIAGKARHGTLWVEVARRDQIEPDTGETVIRGDLVLSGGGRLRLLAGEYSANTPTDTAAGLALDGAGKLVVRGAGKGIDLTDGTAKLSLGANETLLKHSDNHQLSLSATKAELRAGSSPAVLDDTGRLSMADLSVAGPATASALSVTGAASVGTLKATGALHTRLGGDAKITLDPTLSLGASWTIEARFRYPLPASGWNTLARGATSDHHVIVRVSDQALGSYLGGDFRASGHTLAQLSPGWHHLAAVGSGSKTDYYIDGVLKGTYAGKATEAIHTIGNYAEGGQSFGPIRNVAVWGKALNAAQISEAATRVTPLTSGNDLLAHFPMDDSEGIVARNTVGAAGTVAGAPSTALTVGSAAAGFPVPSGTVLMWSGTRETIPVGWALCDGTSGTPDLRARFVVGAGTAAYPAGTPSAGDLSGSRSLTPEQMPNHTHGVVDPGHGHDLDMVGQGSSTDDDDSSLPVWRTDGVTRKALTNTTGIWLQSAGNGAPVDLRPPWYALCFIMKT